MVRNKNECSVKFTKLIDKLYSCKWISSSVGDEAKKEYDVFLDAAQHEHKDAFLSFSFKKDQIDKFLLSYLHENSNYKNLWKICIIIMTLSHGQSAVERGFSVNKELLVENLKKVSIVNQRIVYDHFIASEVKLNEFPISNKLLKSCRLAHSQYIAALEENKKLVISDEKTRKRKMKSDEIAQVNEKKITLESCIKGLEADIETYSIAAEEKNDLSLLTKANSFRKTVREKKNTLEDIVKILERLDQELKNI